MIRLYIKKRLFSYERIIFPEHAVQSDADILRYMRFYELPGEIRTSSWDQYRTPVIDLTADAETIRSRYSKEVRYEVRRAAREDICYRLFERLEQSLIEELRDKYFAFCDSIRMPSLKSNFDEAEIRQMADANNVLVTKAEYENGWVYHIYQVDGRTAMLWFSFSDYRKEGGNRSMAGWANRGLHDFDIMHLKEAGYQTYDFGNIASEDAPNEIDKFKLSFGGTPVTAYCCFVGNTGKGKCLIALRQIKTRLHS